MCQNKSVLFGIVESPCILQTKSSFTAHREQRAGKHPAYRRARRPPPSQCGKPHECPRGGRHPQNRRAPLRVVAEKSALLILFLASLQRRRGIDRRRVSAPADIRPRCSTSTVAGRGVRGVVLVVFAPPGLLGVRGSREEG